MKYFVLALSLIALLALTGCVIEKEVVVIVTATAEPVTDTPASPTATETMLPPPTYTPNPATPTAPPDPTEPGLTPLPDVFPTPVVAQIRVAEQVFERGRMFWIEPTREIWVIIEGGEWLKFPDTFAEGDIENDPMLTPPAGMQQPIRGFGKVWREHVDVQDRLGWATDIEYGYDTAYHYEHGGYVDDNDNYVRGPGIHTLTTLGNEIIHFYERTSTWAFD